MNPFRSFFCLLNQNVSLLFVVPFADVRFQIRVHFYKEIELSLVIDILLGLDNNFVSLTALCCGIFFRVKVVGQLCAELPAFFYSGQPAVFKFIDCVSRNFFNSLFDTGFCFPGVKCRCKLFLQI